METEIKPFQVWERRGARGNRRATAQVNVAELIYGEGDEIVEVVLDYNFSHGAFSERQGRITPAGLRKRYRLVAEQQTLA